MHEYSSESSAMYLYKYNTRVKGAPLSTYA